MFLKTRVPRSSVAQVCTEDTSPYEDMMKGQSHYISAKLKFIPHEEVENHPGLVSYTTLWYLHRIDRS